LHVSVRGSVRPCSSETSISPAKVSNLTVAALHHAER
jgi:hypothetical protein